MPDKRKHRGPHPGDAKDFSTSRIPALRSAVADLSLLLQKGYASNSTLKLVGDRYDLTARQRKAVARAACDDTAAAGRRERLVVPGAVRGKSIDIDGYNLLITLEAALSGGVLLCGRDGTFRDLASMHGSYRRVEETAAALEMAGRYLAAVEPDSVRWLLDRPVSNSGRLKVNIEETAASAGWNWTVRLVPDPDPVLAGRRTIIVSSDSAVLDRCGPWLNLARDIVETHVPDAWILRLG